MSKKLFRYSDQTTVSFVEDMVAKYVGSSYCVAFNSCSSAIFTSIISTGMCNPRIGFPVFTFTAVPSAIYHAGGKAVPINCTNEYFIDIEDLEKQIKDIDILLLSYMRGHFPNVNDVMELCQMNDVIVIEDAAHALGAKYDNKFLGTFGRSGCYSSQSAKIMDSGEGGFLVTDDPDVAAQAIVISGCYEKLWTKHTSKPPEKFLKKYLNNLPCYGLRMHNGTASLLIDQVKNLEQTINHVNTNYNTVKEILSTNKSIVIPSFPENSRPVLDTMQFMINNYHILVDMERFSKETNIECFGVGDNARAYWNWKYLDIPKGTFPHIDALLSQSLDLRLPSKYTEQDVIDLSNDLLDKISVFSSVRV